MPHRRKAIIWGSAASIHWRIYAALEGEKLTGEKDLHTADHHRRKSEIIPCSDLFLFLFCEFHVYPYVTYVFHMCCYMNDDMIT